MGNKANASTQEIARLKAAVDEADARNNAAGAALVASVATRGLISIQIGPPTGPTAADKALQAQQQRANTAAANTVPMLQGPAEAHARAAQAEIAHVNQLQMQAQGLIGPDTTAEQQKAMQLGQAGYNQQLLADAAANQRRSEELSDRAAGMRQVAQTPTTKVSPLRPNPKSAAATLLAGSAGLGIIGTAVTFVKENNALARTEAALNREQAAAGIPIGKRVEGTSIFNPIVIAEQALEADLAQGGIRGGIAATLLMTSGVLFPSPGASRDVIAKGGLQSVESSEQLAPGVYFQAAGSSVFVRQPDKSSQAAATAATLAGGVIKRTAEGLDP